ncbi:MAG: acyl-CoA dehydrogenase [Acidobacteriota bacterium]
MAPAQSTRPPLDHPRLLPFLPLLLMAWADGELSDEELSAIRARLDYRPDAPQVASNGGAAEDCLLCETLDEDQRAAITAWLDPHHPPDAVDLARWRRQLRRGAEALDSAHRRTLAQLGADLVAHRGEQEGGSETISSAEELSLTRLQEALGLNHSAEATRALLELQRPPAAEEAASQEELPSFPLDALQDLLAGRRKALRQEVLDLLGTAELKAPEDADRETLRQHTLRRLKLLADRGWGGLAFPAEVEGGGGDMEGFLTVFETLAFGDLSLLVKFGVQFGLFGGSIAQLGTEHHHRRYLPAVTRLELPGCFAMSETGHGSNVRELETTAHYDAESDELVIDSPEPKASSRKDWIGNAARDGRLATVFAQLTVGEEEHGVHAILVPIRDEEGRPLPGVEIEDCGGKRGLEGVDNGRLTFRSVRVPRKNLLDRFASIDDQGNYQSPIASPSRRFFTMLGTLVGGRVSVALASHSVARTALTIAVRYGSRRRQFGAPGQPETRLLDYPSHQRRLLPRLATTYAYGFALRELAQRYLDSPPDDRRSVEALAAGLKALATRHAVDTVQECREACGGKGYLSENRFGTLAADADIFTTFEGDNTVLLQLVSKGLLSDFKQQFERLDLLGLVRYLADRAIDAVTERNPWTTRIVEAEHLRDGDFQLDVLRHREQHLLSTVAQRLRNRIRRGEESYEAFLACQNHLLALARASIERFTLEQFQAAIDSLQEPSLRAPLERLRSLYALSRIEADLGWFLEHGDLAKPKSQAIRLQVEALCSELRPDARALVDAFGIPDDVLAAPIALDPAPGAASSHPIGGSGA